MKLQKDVQKLREAFMATKKIETNVRKARGRREKALRNGLEQHIFKDFFVTVSSYHGGDMEGNSVRRLMGQGTAIFEEVATFVKGWLIITAIEDDEIDDENIPDAVVDSVCEAFARILVLLDQIFSTLKTPRGQVTAELIAKLRSRNRTCSTKVERVELFVDSKVPCSAEPCCRSVGTNEWLCRHGRRQH